MKSGFVAIVGRPNVGKSTLLNSIVNKKVSIVTDKSQTTRNNILGIYNRDNLQIIFTDTPGIHKPKQKLNEEMNKMAFSAAHDVDAVMLVIDASLPFGEGDQFLIDHVDFHDAPLLIIFNKIDKAYLDKTLKLKEIYKEKFPNAYLIDTVAQDGFNIDEVINTLEKVLPEGPAYYSTAVVTDKDEVFQIKEIIREKALKILKDEVPHSIAIFMDNIDWESNPMHMHATIIVEKEGQKAIVIGTNGQRIKLIGEKARKDIERLLKKHVYLELFVKVEKDWRNEDKLLKAYGYKNEKN